MIYVVVRGTTAWALPPEIGERFMDNTYKWPEGCIFEDEKKLGIRDPKKWFKGLCGEYRIKVNRKKRVPADGATR
jgi:hypothetical protein